MFKAKLKTGNVNVSTKLWGHFVEWPKGSYLFNNNYLPFVEKIENSLMKIRSKRITNKYAIDIRMS